MSVEEIKTLGWIVTIVVMGLSASWFILVMQAFFHDKRIALVGFFGGAIAALSMVFSETVAHTLLAIAGILILGFIGLFLWQNIKRPVIYLTSLVFIASLLGGLWVLSIFPADPGIN